MATNVTWTEGAFAEATFNDGKILKTAYYDYDNQLVGTTTIVDFSVLSKKAREFIAEKYPGASVEKVVLFDDNEANDTDMYLFNRSFEDQDNYFPLLKEGSKEIILKVSMDGSVDFFRDLK